MKGFLIARFLSFITAIVSLSMALPLGWVYCRGGGGGRSLGVSMILGLTLSVVLYAAGQFERDLRAVRSRDAFAIVALSWVAASLIGALPYYIHGMIPSFTDAFFEAMSGFTTTGASILTEIEGNPEGLLLWRGLTHWVGGMGIIVLSLAVLPFIGAGGVHLFKAEVPGFGLGKMTPRVHQIALRLWAIYFSLTALLTALLLLGGMNFFQALSHSFSTIATGGFSPMNKSVSHFPSPFIHWVITLFMFFSGVNFALHYRFLMGLKGAYPADEEFRLYSVIVGSSILFVALALYFRGFAGSPEALLRTSAFQVVSVITSTGFYTEDYILWPVSVQFLFLLLMFAGGCTGSTAGGIKSLRLLALGRSVRESLSYCLHPARVFQLKIRGKAVGRDAVASVGAFFILYLAFFIAGALFLGALGVDFVSAVSSSAAALGNTGPGLGAVGPASNFHSIPLAGKWMLSFFMLLGRLELFTLVVLLSPGTWKK